MRSMYIYTHTHTELKSCPYIDANLQSLCIPLLHCLNDFATLGFFLCIDTRARTHVQDDISKSAKDETTSSFVPINIPPICLWYLWNA